MLFEKIQLEPEERVIKLVRKHWFIIVSELFGTFFMLLLPFVVIFLLIIFHDSLPININYLLDNKALVIFIVSGWCVLTLMSGFMIWTHYYLDLWVITDRRIILIDQVHFFNRNVSSFRLEKLQDIEFYVNGFIPTMLNFGTIKAQTAGSFESNFKTNGLPDPRGLQAIIQKATDERMAILNNRFNSVD